MRARSTFTALALGLGASTIGLSACAGLSAPAAAPTTTTAPVAGGPTYGKPANTTVRFSSGQDVPLEITVTPPVPFTPTDPADATRTANVVFQVTVTNRSPTEPFKLDVAPTAAICGFPQDPVAGPFLGGGTEGDHIFDLEAGISGIDGSPVIEPGKSYTFKDGFSVDCLDDVTYKIEPAGMAADTLYFQK